MCEHQPRSPGIKVLTSDLGVRFPNDLVDFENGRSLYDELAVRYQGQVFVPLVNLWQS